MSINISRSVKLASYSYLNQAFTMVFQLVQIKVLTHFLSLENYGGWSQVNIAINFMLVVFSLNLGHGFIRFASSYDKKKKFETFSSVLMFQVLIIFLVMLILMPFYRGISMFLINEESIFICIIIFFISIFTISVQSIQRFMLVSEKEFQMIRQNLIMIISDVVFTVTGVLILHNLNGALIGFAVSKFFCFSLFSWINNINYSHFVFSFTIVNTLLKFSLPLLSVSIAYWVINSSNRYLINYFMGLDAVGLFSVANRLPMMLVVIFTLLSTIFLTKVSRLYDQQNYLRVSYWFSIIIRLFFFIGIPASAFLIAANQPITLIVANKNYLFQELPLVYLTISIGSLSYGGFMIISRLYDLEKEVYRNSFNYIISMLLNILLNILLIPFFGILGAALATCLTFLVSFIISIVRRPKSISLNLSWLKIFIYSVLSVVLAYFYSVNTINSNNSIFICLVYSFLISLISLAFGVLLRVVSLKELKILINK